MTELRSTMPNPSEESHSGLESTMPPSSEIASEAANDGMSDGAALDQVDDGELLAEGAASLGANLDQLIEQGESAAIADYLMDILETDSKVGKPEMMVAFELLAGSEKARIRAELLEAGVDMLNKFSTVSAEAAQSFERNRPAITNKLAGSEDAYRRHIGRFVRQETFSARGAVGAHDEFVGDSRQAAAKFKELFTPIKAAHDKKMHLAVNFEGKMARGLAHERALGEARAIVQPEYYGEPKDLAQLFDKRTAEGLARQIEEITSTGTPVSEAIAEIITQAGDNDDGNKLNDIRKYMDASLKVDSRKINQIGSNAEGYFKAMTMFARTGQQEFSYARTPMDGQEVFKRQQGMLRRAVENAQRAIQDSGKMLRGGTEDLTKIRSRVS